MKKLILAGLACGMFASAFAGGLLTNTNQSVHFLRNPARDASTEIDAAYTNPAGLSKLPTDGFHFSFTNQSAFQTRTITSTFGNSTANIYPFSGFGGNPEKVFKGEAAAPIVPSLQGAYKKGKWVLSGNLAITGGGGKATFNHGLPSFEAPVSLLPYSVSGNQYSVDSYMQGKQFIFGGQLGGTYQINEMFSVYAGFRMNVVSSSYNGYLHNIETNPGGGNMVNAYNYFNQNAIAAQGIADMLKPANDGGYGTYTLNQLVAYGMLSQPEADQLAGRLGMSPDVATVSQVYGGYTSLAEAAQKGADKTKDKDLDCEQSGWGITPILGFNFSWNKLNIGVKYEFMTNLNVENKTKINTTGVAAYDDGINTPHDIPALLTIGAQYDIIPSVTVSCGYHHFFDSDAKMADNKQEYINGGINEYLLGAEWRIDNMFLVSAGGQITRTGVTDAYQTDMSFSLNSYSIGFGGAVNVSPSVRINIGYFFTNYEDWTKKYENYADSGMPGKDIFSRTNKVFGAGVDFRF